MSFEDDEILQDFLIEAGEILEQLNEQLVELESRPDDNDLLNAVFRGFHTIKGGGGFLGLTPLVEVCHRAEDVFNQLRNGEKQVDENLMDVILPVLDVLNSQFDNLKGGLELEEADEQLLKSLDALIAGDSTPSAAAEAAPQESAVAEVDVPKTEETPAAVENVANTDSTEKKEDNLSDEEFENLLNALDSKEIPPTAPELGGNDAGGVLFDENDAATGTASNGDDISEDEFEALLDQLHGKGKFSAANSKEQGEKPEIIEAVVSPEAEKTEDSTHQDRSEATVKKETPPPGDPVPTPEPEPVKATVIPRKQKKEAKPVAKPSGNAQADATVRVDTKRLDDIMNMVGELVLVRNRLVTLESTLANEEMAKAVSNLDVVTADLQMAVMKTRMQPIKKVFGRFPRVVRDLARNLKKKVKLELVGEDTDLDKNLVEALADPLVHLVRNSVDHGVEMPDVRAAKGKPVEGTVILAAEQEGDHIILSIDDDGAGMDPEVLRRKVVEKGLMDEESAARLEDKECYALIFMPGFSTKDEISDVSGRGVGMDVVKTRISQLNGGIDIDSELGRGTRITINVPLTLAIMPTLMVKLREQTFALPLVSVNEIFHLDLTKTKTVDGQLVIMIRNKALPLFYLTRWLVKGAEYDELPEFGHVVVVHVGARKVGFVVNFLLGQEEVVIKPLGTLLQGTQGLAGATITGDGKIAIILDVPGLMQTYAR